MDFDTLPTPDAGVAASHDDDILTLEPTMRVSDPAPVQGGLLNGKAFEAATRSLSSLQTTLDARPVPGHTIGGKTSVMTGASLTVEDLVRQEVRELVRNWLDTNLPPMVETMVRAEITRITSRR